MTRTELKQLESTRDQLRSKLQGMARLNNLGDDFMKLSDDLTKLDKEFFQLCRETETELSKFGRLK